MATVHVLEATEDHGFRCVIHFATPLGNNSAGVTWKATGLAAGILGSTILTVGAGPKQTTQVEFDSIVAGDTVEFETTLRANTQGMTGAQLGTVVDQLAQEEITAYQNRVSRLLRWYGATRA